MLPEPDDPAHRVSRIDLNDDVDVSLWAMVFGSTPGSIRKAVSQTGNDPEAVQVYMRRNRLGMWAEDVGDDV